ncbi:MAG: aromatic ring-hydroxylating dioxygenase subunit alpha [bacterium]|nr:aromatic ring-hydroxylating dioxygenase subunit alpha [bacterium]
MNKEQKKLMIDNCGNLKNAWYAVALSSELPKSQLLSKSIMEYPLVLWRNNQGMVQVLSDRCMHRNAPLSKGKLAANCVVCPYHGWVFNGEGHCVEIPSEGPNTDRIPKHKIESFPCKEESGLIWVWMGREVPVNTPPFYLPRFEGKGWQHYFMVTDFEQGITDLVENFMDVPHTVFVHKGWFRERSQICIKANVKRTSDSVLVTYEQGKDAISFSSKILNPKGLPMKHTDNFYMPNTTRVDYVFGEMERAFIITSTCTPITPELSRVYTLITYRFGRLNALAKLFLPWYTKKVIMQDVKIMKMQADNIKKFGQKDFRSTKVDAMHLYIESLREHAEKASEEPIPPVISKEIEFWV